MHKEREYFFQPHVAACYLVPPRRILRVSFRVVTRLSPPPPCAPITYLLCPSLFPSARSPLSIRANPTLSGRNSSTLPRWSGSLKGGRVSTPRRARERFAFLGSYRKHAHVPCIKPGGGRRGSKVVWFHVRRVQRLPSLHATHEIPKVQVSRVSRGDALLTVCRAAMLVISSLFFYRSL